MDTMGTVIGSRAPASGTQAQRARRGLLLFGLLLLPLSLFGYWFYDVAEARGLPLGTSLPIMLAPGLASVITRLVLREGFADVSFKIGGTRRAILFALALPLLVGTVAYSGAYITGLAQFTPPPAPSFLAWAGSFGSFVFLMALVATLGTLVLLPTAAGEEIGWRGYLLPRLIEAGVPHPILLSGLIWGAWHMVPVFTAGYAAGASPLLSALGLMIAILAFGYILSWMRLDTGSVWPAVVGHAAWNAMINGGFDLATGGENAKLWTGESGFLVVLVLVVVTVLVGRARRSAAPGASTFKG
ncbi:MAG TPA: type II CAAX endopeptidase family protein [Ardenticatenaceae bacterium]|jgi:membrane protease YdiL (CAAX protease family)